MTEHEAFEEWFMDLLESQPTCLMRDVLRDTKEALFKAWQHRKPVEFTR